MKKPKKILIIRFSSIGDIILSFPLVEKLKNLFPDCEIDYLTGINFVGVLTPIKDLINTIIKYDKTNDRSEIKRMQEEIQTANYDWILDIHGSLRSRRLLFNVKSPVFRIRKNQIRRFLYIRFKWNIYPLKHVSQKYADVLPVADADKKITSSFKINAPIIKRYFDKNFDSVNTDRSKVILFPGAKHFTKRWPPEYWKQLIEILIRETDWRIIIAGDKFDKQLVDESKMDQHSRVYNLCGQLNLLETMSLIQKSDIAVTNDSGPMHIAAMFDKAQVAIFGNTVLQLGFAPLNSNSIILENNSLSCRPCSHIGYEKCPKKHFKCMKEIHPEEVFKSVMLLFQKTLYS